jgi:hypothetical protein
LIDRIANISKTLGVTEDAAKTLLKVVGEDPNIPEDGLADALSKVGADYKRLQVQAAALNPQNPTARGLIERARSEINAGHLGRAHELLRQATQEQVAAAQEAEKLEQQAHAAYDAQMLGAAESTAADADVARTERRYLDAAELFAQAANYVPAGHPSEHGHYLFSEGEALYEQGEERGDNAALKRSIDVYRQAFADYPRDRTPLDWAATQNGLGKALAALGWRENETARLEEAVAAYRAALEERTRERVPRDWASTQYGLGDALEGLDGHGNGTTRLEEAVAAYRAALEERTRERVPHDWALTQLRLGDTLKTLGRRENGTARLEEAVAAYRATLTVWTLEEMPNGWASTQYRLAGALQWLGERESGTARLSEALEAFQACLIYGGGLGPTWIHLAQTRHDETQAEIARRSTK